MTKLFGLMSANLAAGPIPSTTCLAAGVIRVLSAQVLRLRWRNLDDCTSVTNANESSDANTRLVPNASRATVPTPSVLVEDPATPTLVTTCRVWRKICLMTARSTTSAKEPSDDTAMPLPGFVKEALSPNPSTELPAVLATLPASVVVLPVSASVCRISLLPQSVTSSWHGWYPPAAQGVQLFGLVIPRPVEKLPLPHGRQFAEPNPTPVW